MKAKEVIKGIEKMKLQVDVTKDYLFVIHRNGKTVANMNLNRKFQMSTNFWAFQNMLTEDEREKVYFLLTKLAETDPEDREEEKKYYLRHKWLNVGYSNYLNFYITENDYQLFDKPNMECCKTQFTQEEIDEIKERFNTNLEDFEQIPVEDKE